LDQELPRLTSVGFGRPGFTLDCYERKQIIPLARRTRERLDALQPAQT